MSAFAGPSNIQDVARRAGVSVVTVSRVFNNYPHVSDRMRQRVLAAARHVGYQPHVVTRPRLLGLLTDRIASWGEQAARSALLGHLLRAAAAQGFVVEVIPADKVDLATQHHADALLEWGILAAQRESLYNLPPAPRVSLNQILPDRLWHAVTVDFYQESQRAVTHLREHGHRRIALVLDDEHAWADERRRAGYEDVLRAHSGSEFRALTLTTARQSMPEIAAAIRQANCTACVNFSERLGVALIHHLITQERIKVPDDLSVVTLDAEPATGCFTPPLTGLSEPHAELAERAILLLAGNVLGPGERTVVTLPAQLIERASVRGPRKA